MKNLGYVYDVLTGLLKERSARGWEELIAAKAEKRDINPRAVDDQDTQIILLALKETAIAEKTLGQLVALHELSRLS